MKKNTVSINYVRDDVCSFLKGYWYFISNKSNRATKSNKIYNYVKNLLGCGAMVCISFIMLWRFENIIINHMGLLKTETTRKPRDFNLDRGDYCIEDSNGKIIKCVIEFPPLMKHFLLILIFLLLIVNIIVLYNCIDITLNVIKKPIVNFILTLKISIEEYEQFRKHVKNDIAHDVVTIV